MKAFLLPFLVALPLGWWALATLNSKDQPISEKTSAVASRTSLLGLRQEGARALPAYLRQNPGLVARLEFLESVDTATPSTLEGWILDLIDSSPGRNEYERIAQLLGKYGELDPERALAFIAKHVALEHHRGAVIGGWATKDWRAAAAKALELEPTGHLIYSVVLVVDPEGALALHDLLKEKGFDQAAPGQFANLFSHLYTSGAEQAAGMALAHMLSVDRNRASDHGLEGVFRQWIEDDAEAAWAWADGQDNPAAREIAISRLVDAWREKDVQGALEAVWPRLDTKQRDQLIDQLGNSSDVSQDTDALLSWLDTHVESPEWRNKLIAGMVEGLRNSQHPEQLATLIEYVDVSDRRVQGKIQQAVRQWAEVDVEGLNAWIDSIDEANVRALAMKGMVDQLIRTNPDKALTYLTDADIGTELADSISVGSLGNLMMNLDPTRHSMDVLIGQFPEALQEKAYEGYAEAVVKESPREALRHFEAMPEGNARSGGIQRSLSHWAVEAPKEAAAWVDELPEGTDRRFAALNLVNNWARSDLQGARDWLDSQAPGASRDAAAMELAKVQASRDPEDALRLLQSLGPAPEEWDYRLHGEIEQILATVAQEDAAGAEAAVASVGLSDSARERMEKSVRESVALKAHFSKENVAE